NLYNLEATPAEGTTYRFAKEDLKRYPDILQAGTREQPYYTNSSQLPVGHTDDPIAALIHQEPLQQRYTGGTVLHLYNSDLLDLSGPCYLSGEHEFCPKCDEALIQRKQQEVSNHAVH
ncbi:MAG: anaerobic ribonucleoside-triphosphate reductase, partial [Candidatus Thiodiazotropha sp.]